MKKQITATLTICFLLIMLIFKLSSCGKSEGSSNYPNAAKNKVDTDNYLNVDNKSKGNPAPEGIEVEPIELFTYEYDNVNQGVRLTGYSGEKTVVRIPDTIEDMPVVSISDSCFKAGVVTDVYFPSTIKEFHLGRLDPNFEGSLIIPYGVTALRDALYDGFNGCTLLTSVIIPDSATKIGSGAFEGCSSLTSITIPDSVTTIGFGAFADFSSLTSITIPDNVKSIDSVAFGGCSSLTSITIPDSVTEIEQHTFMNCSSLTNVTIGNSVKKIGFGAFEGCSSLTSITIPDSVRAIGETAFSWCSSLTSITIPDSVTEIGKSAFYNCSSLSNVTIGNSVTTIVDYTFDNCSSLTNVTIGNSVKKIGEKAFYRCTSLSLSAQQQILQVNSKIRFDK